MFDGWLWPSIYEELERDCDLMIEIYFRPQVMHDSKETSKWSCDPDMSR